MSYEKLKKNGIKVFKLKQFYTKPTKIHPETKSLQEENKVTESKEKEKDHKLKQKQEKLPTKNLTILKPVSIPPILIMPFY